VSGNVRLITNVFFVTGGVGWVHGCAVHEEALLLLLDFCTWPARLITGGGQSSARSSQFSSVVPPLFLKMRVTLFALLVCGACQATNLVGLVLNGATSGIYARLVPGPNNTYGVKQLAPDRGAALCAESTLDMATSTHWFLEDDFIIHGFNLTSSSFGRKTYLNMDPCLGAGTCVSEWSWDSAEKAVVAVGMGTFGVNTLVNIDPHSGNITRAYAGTFSDDCGLVLGGTAFSQKQRALYVSLECPGLSSIFKFDLAAGTNSTMISSKGGNLPSRLVYDDTHGLLGFGFDGPSLETSTLYRIADGSSSPLCPGRRGTVEGAVHIHTVSITDGVLYAVSSSNTSANIIVSVALGSCEASSSVLDMPSDTIVGEIKSY
jgi:hypothetical protein